MEKINLPEHPEGVKQDSIKNGAKLQANKVVDRELKVPTGLKKFKCHGCDKKHECEQNLKRHQKGKSWNAQI